MKSIIRVVDKWYKILDEGGCIDVIYCDFIKAFDKVPHRRLLKRLESSGISVIILDIISKQQKTESELRPFQVGGCYKWYTPRLSTRSPTICDLYKRPSGKSKNFQNIPICRRHENVQGHQ